VAIGSVAWYYHLYGREAFAMTPQEEGSDHFPLTVRYLSGQQLTDACNPDYIRLNIHGNTPNGQRPLTTKREYKSSHFVAL
jgi:hypothetical protein